MSEKPKKKQIVLRVLLILLIVLLAVIIIPIAQLFVQYRRLSYTPMQPVERSDTYVMPDYPEVIPGSDDSADTTDVPETEVTAGGGVSTSGEDLTSSTASGPPSPTGEGKETTATVGDGASTSRETTSVPETAAPPPETTAAPETLPSVTYAPEDETPVTHPPPKYNEANSFSNSNAMSVYGETPIYKMKQIDPDIINILIMGSDSRDVVIDRGRSDLMIVVSYNQKTGAVKMVSLLRDLLVPVEGYGWDRINTAYFFDGAGLAVNTVNQLFGLDIQYFVVVDLNGVKDFINYIGGIDITLTEAEAKCIGVEYSPGPVHLNGAKTLMHARNRDIGSDFGRTERQRKVIVTVCNKIIAENSITEILDITQFAMRVVKTNIPVTTLTSIAVSVLGNGKSLTVAQQSIPYNDAFQFARYRGMSIISFDIQSTAERMRAFLYE